MAIKTIRRKKRKSNRLQTLFFLALIGLSAFILLDLKLFDIQTIIVENNNVLTQEDIIETSGIKEGSNIFRENLLTAAKNLKSMSFIDDVNIDRKLPSTIIIKVTERVAVLSVLEDDSANYIIDESGVVLSKGYVYANYGIPVLTGYKMEKGLEVGAVCTAKELQSILEMVKQTPDPCRDCIAEIKYLDANQLVLYTSAAVGGWPIRFGGLEDIAEKMEVLAESWDNVLVRKDDIEYLDISYYQFPVIKYKS